MMKVQRRRRRVLAAATTSLVCGAVLFATAASGSAKPSTAKSGPVLALTMTYTGNSWGKACEQAFIATAKKLEKAGKISGYLTSNANNNAATQSTQITDYVLKKVGAIVVEASSATGLNGAIAQAHAAGIPVIVIETGPVTSPYAYEINPNVLKMGAQSMKAAIRHIHGKGNVLYIQGVAGNPFTNTFKQGVEKAAKQHPGIHVILGPFSNWTETTSQSDVTKLLPSLPKIAGIVSEGGETYGAVQAFIHAGRKVPVAIGGNRGYFLRWWYRYHKKHRKYKTESMEANPWIGGAGAYVAMDILGGMKVPLKMTWPILKIKNPKEYRNLPASAVASHSYGNKWVVKNVIKG